MTDLPQSTRAYIECQKWAELNGWSKTADTKKATLDRVPEIFENMSYRLTYDVDGRGVMWINDDLLQEMFKLEGEG